MKVIALLASAALPLMAAAISAPAQAYDNDEQALRLRDTVADPSVPLAWDRRDHPETWRYRHHGWGRHDHGCGRHAYWNGEDCVRKRRHR